MTVVDEEGTVSSSLNFKQEDEEREKEMSEFYSRQIVQVIDIYIYIYIYVFKI